MIKVLKASAGAGKTFNLVLEYIKALMKAEERFLTTGKMWAMNPHRHILAITFTNNSTNEMKERILKDLHKLANGKQEQYEDEIVKWAEEFKLKDDEKTRLRIRETAKMLLDNILNDYSMMRVSTIDSFFNQIIRSFSRDLGLDQTPVAEIDDAHIREKAVDTMLSELDGEANKELLKFIKEFSHSQISEGKKWKIRDSLIEFSKILLTEDYTSNFDGDNTTLTEIAAFKEKLRKFVKEQKAIADKAFEQMTEIATAHQDGMLKNTFNAIVERKMNSTLWNNDTENVTFFKKGKGSADVENALKEHFATIKGSICSTEYHTKALILKSIYITGVLGELSRVTDQICRDNDCILLSTANHLITKIIDGCDAPFIYERVGVSTNHYMIDEFQDTSHTQWENFMPLIKEANAGGNDSLIVGDIKQSIYRWRNGDWKILHNGIKEAFAGNMKEKPLEHNHRSSHTIVDFNNHLYTELPKLMDEALKTKCFQDIYSNSKQLQPDHTKDLKGSIETHFVSKAAKSSEFMEYALRLITNDIARHDKDYWGGTAIIVRNNSEASQAAAALAAAGIPFCSSDSFLLKSDAQVQLTMAYLRHIIAPEEKLYEHELRHALEGLKNPAGIKDLESLEILPLEEIPMALMDELGLKATQFVHSLVDTIKRYVMNNDASIPRFIEWWEEHEDDLCIPMAKLAGTVTIMTIHKSKGLEFPNVYLLLAKEPWRCGINGKHKNYRTVTTNEIPHVILNINDGEMKETDYSDIYEAEYLDCCVDTLNTLYVATTRAVNNLFIVAHLADAKTGIHINDLLMHAVDGVVEELKVEGEELRVEGGGLKDEGGELKDEGEELKVEGVGKKRSIGFAKIVQQSKEQRHGTVCHMFLSLIEKEGDEIAAFEKMMAGGTVTEGDKEELMKVYSFLAAKGIFDPKYKSMNEKSIAINGNVYRPDRIIFKDEKSVLVVDYKFGEKRPEHEKQIGRYAELLKGMGYEVETAIYYRRDIEL